MNIDCFVVDLLCFCVFDFCDHLSFGCRLLTIAKTICLRLQPIRVPKQILYRIFVISMEILLLRCRHPSWHNVPSGKEQGETFVFADYASFCPLV